MLIFDLKDLKKDDMISYLKCMSAIAAVDGKVDETEKIYFNHMMELFHVPEASRIFIRRNLENPPPLVPILRDIKDTKVKNMIVRDAYLMALADDSIAPQESAALTAIKNVFGISDAQIEKISEWAKRGLDWRKQGQDIVNVK
jgi:uncharacterized tellurite resistance protein B-like protein